MSIGTEPRAFVLFTAGAKKYALPADMIEELAPPVRLHKFAHATASVVGVIVRRGRIVPVHDLLSTAKERLHRFYLIARRNGAAGSEFDAIPVDGECMMRTAEIGAPPAGHANYVCGTVNTDDQTWSVLDFDALLSSGHAAAPIASGPASQGVRT